MYNLSLSLHYFHQTNPHSVLVQPHTHVLLSTLASASPAILLLVIHSLSLHLPFISPGIHTCILVSMHPLIHYPSTHHPVTHTPTIHLFIHPPSIYLSIHLTTHLSIQLSLHPSIHSSIYISMHPFIHHPGIHLPTIHLSIYIPIIHLFIHPPSIYVSNHPSVIHPSIHPITSTEDILDARSCISVGVRSSLGLQGATLE